MIYEPVKAPIEGDYYYCAWMKGTTQLLQQTTEDSPLTSPTYPGMPPTLDSFAMDVSDGYQAFLSEIADRGLDPIIIVEE